MEFANRGFATRFEDGATRTLVDLAREAVVLAGPRASEWLTGVKDLDQTWLDEILSFAVTLSARRRTFIREVLRENRRRLLA